jgi:hypothetical protein
VKLLLENISLEVFAYSRSSLACKETIKYGSKPPPQVASSIMLVILSPVTSNL